ncbi:hypothetical protein E2I00_018161 [Balaenoptera physalus]|uniref:Transcription cofactor vestigial-like protein 2 n=1 Tax=Balaenoptera physalus TaxID=9770 RepID=A0A643ATB6_BALPH|nr:hypothetical protein E2I00_018161 [Balaenoptera physalus]
MSCLDVMYQVYGPPQPYFAAAYTPYHQKLAYYSKMQEAQECNASPSNSSGSGSSFSSQTPASIKEEEGSPEKERPPEAEYINSRCVLFTYFQGDISSVVDEHFSRALSQPSSYSPSCTSSKAPRSSGPWRGNKFDLNAVLLKCFQTLGVNNDTDNNNYYCCYYYYSWHPHFDAKNLLIKTEKTCPFVSPSANNTAALLIGQVYSFQKKFFEIKFLERRLMTARLRNMSMDFQSIRGLGGAHFLEQGRLKRESG